ncbi:MAG: hypothetical protein IH840_15880 [Candidatus Heimdallarchaeota archaeon]|nr:hypothetical protein [Candidatus Heimdallarchaeota archaeon]
MKALQRIVNGLINQEYVDALPQIGYHLFLILVTLTGGFFPELVTKAALLGLGTLGFGVNFKKAMSIYSAMFKQRRFLKSLTSVYESDMLTANTGDEVREIDVEVSEIIRLGAVGDLEGMKDHVVRAVDLSKQKVLKKETK